MTDNRSARSDRAVTIALLAASLLLAVIGGLLLTGAFGSARRQSQAQPQAHGTVAGQLAGSAAPEATGAPPAVPLTPSLASPASASPAAEESAVAAELPGAAVVAARQFTIAWASHDARPGRDTSFEDAGRRAAAYAAPGLAEDLASPRPNSASRWAALLAARTQVTAQILSVGLPDGAPEPSETTALVRVQYQLTIAPEGGSASTSIEQVALEVRLGTDGTWRVTALPYA